MDAGESLKPGLGVRKNFLAELLGRTLTSWGCWTGGLSLCAEAGTGDKECGTFGKTPSIIIQATNCGLGVWILSWERKLGVEGGQQK